MPFCPECGTSHEGTKFCPNCGTPQSGAATSPPPAPPSSVVAPAVADAPEEIVWEGESKNFANAASRGRVVQSRYRLTNQTLYFTKGVVSTSSEQVPLWAVRDLDVQRNLLQKSRGTGDIRVRVQHSDYTGRAWVTLESIEDPMSVRDLINQHAQRARLEYDERARTRLYSQRP